MSDVTLRNCTFAYKCTQQWDNLEETHEEGIRFCHDCQKEVHYCKDDQELLESIKLNRCIAFSRNETIHEMGLIIAPEYQKQEILSDETRSEILKKIMMLKNWFEENMDVELTRNEYNYIAERLLKQTGLEYSNRDLFGLQVWALKVPVLPGKWYREDSIKDGTNFDDNIIEFMDSVGLNWSYWGKHKAEYSVETRAMKINDLITYVTSEDRVCPNPVKWNEISEIIDVAKSGHPHVPLILAGWTFSSDIEKRNRLIEQIKYAKTLKEELFDKFVSSIYSLEDDDWYYSKEKPLSTWKWDGT